MMIILSRLDTVTCICDAQNADVKREMEQLQRQASVRQDEMMTLRNQHQHALVSCSIIPRLHDQAGSTSWLYVSWTSQFDVCSICWMSARCLLDGLLNVCSMSVRYLLNRVNGV